METAVKTGHAYKPKITNSPNSYYLEDNRTNPKLPFFELNAIVAATDKFSSSKRLEQGGFGSVYKATLYLQLHRSQYEEVVTLSNLSMLLCVCQVVD